MKRDFTNKVQCARTGFYHPANEMRREYDGKWVHNSVFLKMNPQDVYVRTIKPIIPYLIQSNDEDNYQFQSGTVDPSTL